MSKERLEKESGGQIIGHEDLNDEILKENLESWFCSRTKKKQAREQINNPGSASPASISDNTLVVCMGSNLPTTLIAIASHNLSNVVLCYTPNDKRVEGYSRRLQEHASELGLESVILAPLSVEGMFADACLPDAAAAANVHVNISPGSKGQGAMLANWAARRNFPVWSVLNKDRKCVRLESGELAAAPVPMRFCDPAAYFKITGFEMLDAGEREEERAQDRPFYEALTRLMQEAVKYKEYGKKLDDFLQDANSPYPACTSLKIGFCTLTRILHE